MSTNLVLMPSTAIFVKPDLSIFDCVMLMRDRGIGSILVSAPDNPRKIAGIFTERDLLKWGPEIRIGSHWDKPIATLMTKDVVTVSTGELDRAATIMLERNIRHLPVVESHAGSAGLTVAIVSIRDVLTQEVFSRKQSAAAPRTEVVRTGILTQQHGVRDLMRKICGSLGQSAPEDVSLEAIENDGAKSLSGFEFLILDLDGIEPRRWASLLKELNRRDEGPNIIVIFDPGLHGEAATELLEKVTHSGRLSGFLKPLNVFAIRQSLASTQPK